MPDECAQAGREVGGPTKAGLALRGARQGRVSALVDRALAALVDIISPGKRCCGAWVKNWHDPDECVDTEPRSTYGSV